MAKPICIVQGPLATRSGYGDLARDIIMHLIELDRYDLKLISTPWGATPMNALDATVPADVEIIKRVQGVPLKLERQPELFIHITIPNEFMTPAKVNIGITAGIETDMCSLKWIEGCNRMNTVWGISRHAVDSIQSTNVTKQDAQGNVMGVTKTTIPMEVLPCYIDTNVYRKLEPTEILTSVDEQIATIPEKFCFLFVGHWLRGGMGEDRKNVGLLVKTFCETFNYLPKAKQPALILKTSSADFSVLDREEMLTKIKQAKGTIDNCPNVYLLHGDMTREELNSLYNHPKVKAHVSFTKGEGFGRPLLEASVSGKPVIASGWSGHIDFLNPTDAVLLNGELRSVEPGAVWEDILIRESHWFNVDVDFARKALKLVFTDYERYYRAETE